MKPATETWILILMALLAMPLNRGLTEDTIKPGQNAPPAVGEVAPDFELLGLDGKKVKLSTVAAEGPVALIVLRGYPGYQCPVCTKQVAELIGAAEKLREKRAQVLLVYPGPAENLKKRADEFLKDQPLPKNFRLLIDPGYELTNAYHLRWDAPAETAYPSTFVLNGERKVKFAKVSKTHGGRASVAEVLKALE